MSDAEAVAEAGAAVTAAAEADAAAATRARGTGLASLFGDGEDRASSLLSFACRDWYTGLLQVEVEDEAIIDVHMTVIVVAVVAVVPVCDVGDD